VTPLDGGGSYGRAVVALSDIFLLAHGIIVGTSVAAGRSHYRL
jgi:hypothetical protein